MVNILGYNPQITTNNHEWSKMAEHGRTWPNMAEHGHGQGRLFMLILEISKPALGKLVGYIVVYNIGKSLVR